MPNLSNTKRYHELFFKKQRQKKQTIKNCRKVKQWLHKNNGHCYTSKNFFYLLNPTIHPKGFTQKPEAVENQTFLT